MPMSEKPEHPPPPPQERVESGNVAAAASMGRFFYRFGADLTQADD